jgi:hypothetical protein
VNGNDLVEGIFLAGLECRDELSVVVGVQDLWLNSHPGGTVPSCAVVAWARALPRLVRLMLMLAAVAVTLTLGLSATHGYLVPELPNGDNLGETTKIQKPMRARQCSSFVFQPRRRAFLRAGIAFSAAGLAFP